MGGILILGESPFGRLWSATGSPLLSWPDAIVCLNLFTESVVVVGNIAKLVDLIVRRTEEVQVEYELEFRGKRRKGMELGLDITDDMIGRSWRGGGEAKEGW